jgi:uncharacterized protein (TIGR00106 family)
MVLMEFSMSPIGQGTSVSPYVARALDLVDRSGLDYRLGALGTTVEGSLDQLLDLLRQCFQAMTADCERVTCYVKFDYRKDRSGRLQGHVASVERQLGRTLKHD